MSSATSLRCGQGRGGPSVPPNTRALPAAQGDNQMGLSCFWRSSWHLFFFGGDALCIVPRQGWEGSGCSQLIPATRFPFCRARSGAWARMSGVGSPPERNRGEKPHLRPRTAAGSLGTVPCSCPGVNPHPPAGRGIPSPETRLPTPFFSRSHPRVLVSGRRQPQGCRRTLHRGGDAGGRPGPQQLRIYPTAWPRDLAKRLFLLPISVILVRARSLVAPFGSPAALGPARPCSAPQLVMPGAP